MTARKKKGSTTVTGTITSTPLTENSDWSETPPEHDGHYWIRVAHIDGVRAATTCQYRFEGAAGGTARYPTSPYPDNEVATIHWRPAPIPPFKVTKSEAAPPPKPAAKAKPKTPKSKIKFHEEKERAAAPQPVAVDDGGLLTDADSAQLEAERRRPGLESIDKSTLANINDSFTVIDTGK